MFAFVRSGETLLTALVLWPLIAAIALAGLSAIKRRGGAWLAVVATGVTLVLAALLAGVEGPAAVRIPAFLGVLELRAEPAGRALALVAALVWFAASVYSLGYLRDDPAADRLRVTSLAVLSGNLGVFVAGDWLSLLVFFEFFGLAGLLFVVHAGDAAARRAGIKYFWLTLTGGVALLAGIVLLQQATGSTSMAPVPDTGMARWALALMLAGFGVKAGLLGLHVWLPDAHSAAPAPASALLSGVMIKAGAYGIFRCFELFSIDIGFGLALLCLGLAGMLIGAIAALAQRHAKRLLAWSSISQMGFILAAFGAAAIEGPESMLGRGAGLLHAFNHALFKSALFLAVGAAVHAAGSADLDRLGGMHRRAPVLFALLLVAVAGIVGLPPLNGFASKTMIHHALAHLSARHDALAIAEWIYYAASIGTAAMFARLVAKLSAAPDRARATAEKIPATMLVAIGLLAVLIVAAGLGRGPVFEAMVLPALGSQPAAVAQGAAAGLLHFSPADHIAPFAILIAGLAAAWLADRFGLVDRRLPAWASVDAAYRGIGRSVPEGCKAMARYAARLRRGGLRRAGRIAAFVRRGLALNWTDSARITTLGARMRMPHDRAYRHLDQQRERIIHRALALAGRRSASLSSSQRAHVERLLDATHHYAGWLGTRLVNAGVALDAEDALRLAHSDDCCRRLAEQALEMAVTDVESGHERRALALADDALAAVLGGRGPASIGETPTRRGVHELRSVLFHLVLDPMRSHWPVSESLARGAFPSQLRRYLHRLARDPGAGLAFAFGVLVVLVALLARA